MRSYGREGEVALIEAVQLALVRRCKFLRLIARSAWWCMSRIGLRFLWVRVIGSRLWRWICLVVVRWRRRRRCMRRSFVIAESSHFQVSSKTLL